MLGRRKVDACDQDGRRGRRKPGARDRGGEGTAPRRGGRGAESVILSSLSYLRPKA